MPLASKYLIGVGGWCMYTSHVLASLQNLPNLYICWPVGDGSKFWPANAAVRACSPSAPGGLQAGHGWFTVLQLERVVVWGRCGAMSLRLAFDLAEHTPRVHVAPGVVNRARPSPTPACPARPPVLHFTQFAEAA